MPYFDVLIDPLFVFHHKKIEKVEKPAIMYLVMQSHIQRISSF